MFERFTDRARHVVTLAQVEARDLDHNYIGTEHLLLGLISEADGIGGRALAALGLTQEAVQAEIKNTVGVGKAKPAGHIPFTPRAKKALELSLREALKLGHNYIGTEHLLLGLVRLNEGAASQLLQTKVEGGLGSVESSVFGLLIEAGSISRGKATAHIRGSGSPVGPRIVVGGSEQVLVRLEAIEARLSAIEALLRAQGEEREAQ